MAASSSAWPPSELSRPPTDQLGIESTAHVGEAIMRWVRKAGQMSDGRRSARSRRARRVGREPLAEQSLNGRRAQGRGTGDLTLELLTKLPLALEGRTQFSHGLS